MSFSDLGLAPELLRALGDAGYTEPTPIQRQAIPAALAGRDLLAAAQTGTGKTAAFALPMLQRLSATRAAAPRALILAPTRELAAQINESIKTYGRHFRLRSAVIFGGVGMMPQVDRLRRDIDLIVATPGRLLDHLRQGTVNLGAIEILVLDEADRMLDMGFIPDVRRLLAALPRKRQTLFFSATFNEEIRTLASGMLQDPTTIEVATRNTPAAQISQRIHPVDKSRKSALIAHLVTTGNWNQVLVFTRTKHGANRLAEQLTDAGIAADAIHGNKSQGARTKALANFKSGAIRLLVATDIASRGIDIDQLPYVINHELPDVPEDYVHRIGRTGRAGSSGEAISLVSSEERSLLRDIQRLLRCELPSAIVPGFEPSAAPVINALSSPRHAGYQARASHSSPGSHGEAGHGSAAPGRAEASVSTTRGNRPAGAWQRPSRSLGTYGSPSGRGGRGTGKPRRTP